MRRACRFKQVKLGQSDRLSVHTSGFIRNIISESSQRISQVGRAENVDILLCSHLSSPFPFLAIPVVSTSLRRHTRLVGSSLQLFVQAAALLWARSRAFLGVNFNESGTAFAYQRRFMCILGVTKLSHFLTVSDHFEVNLFMNENIEQLSNMISN